VVFGCDVGEGFGEEEALGVGEGEVEEEVAGGALDLGDDELDEQVVGDWGAGVAELEEFGGG
jgi:hypothetical protein